MSFSESAVRSERKGYARGLILGLTMAETFLLLVFCLLLVAVAAISAQRKVATEAIAERDRLQLERQELVEANSKLEETISGLPPEIIARSAASEDWRELTLAKELAAAIYDAGVSSDEAVRLAPTLKVLKDNAYLSSQTPAAERLEAALTAAEQAHTQQPHSWPPIINLSEAGGYYFAVGSAELTPAFRRQLSNNIIARIANYLKQYQVDIVEVIGHTDEQPFPGVASNLDYAVSSILSGQARAADIRPADNAGLGLARAIAVVELLRRDPRLGRATILPLSGAQLIMPGDEMTDGQQTGDLRERRRIEIRIRRRSYQIE